MGVMDDRRRMIAAQPHLVTLTGSGGLVAFNTGFVAPMQITAESGATVTSCGKNLFDKTAVGVGENILTDGTIGYSGNARLSGYIPTPNGKAVVHALRTGGGNGIRIGRFDANKGWIDRIISSEVGDYSVYTLNNSQVAYIRVCIFVNSEDINTAMVELGTTRTAFEAFSGSTTNHISQIGYNTVFADSGPITVKAWVQ